MLMIHRISHVDSSRESVFGIRESKIELQVSQDNGTSFQTIGFFTTSTQKLDRGNGGCVPTAEWRFDHTRLLHSGISASSSRLIIMVRVFFAV